MEFKLKCKRFHSYYNGFFDKVKEIIQKWKRTEKPIKTAMCKF